MVVHFRIKVGLGSIDLVYRRIAEYGIVFRRKRYHQPYVVLVGKIGQRLDVLLVQRAEDNIHVLHLAFAEYGV